MPNGLGDFGRRQRDAFNRARQSRLSRPSNTASLPDPSLLDKVNKATTAKPSVGKAATATGLRRAAGTVGRFAAPVALADTAIKTARTPTEAYRKRFGLETNDPSFIGDLGVRALGAASDLGNFLTGGIAGDALFRDKRAPRAAPVQQPQQPKEATPTQVSLRRPRTEVQPLLNRDPNLDEVSSIESPTGGTAEISGRNGLRSRVQRQVGGTEGRGTFSVVNTGRTPEEQAAIDQRVADIDSQTNAIRSARAANLGIPEGTLDLLGNGVRVSDVKQALLQNVASGGTAGLRRGGGAPSASDLISAQRLQRDLNRDVRDAQQQQLENQREADKVLNEQIDRIAVNPETGEVDQRRRQKLDQIFAGLDPNSREFADAKTFLDIAESARPRATASTGLVDESGLTGNLLDTLTLGLFENDAVGPQTLEELQAEVTNLANTGQFLGQDIDTNRLPDRVKKQLELIRQAQQAGRTGLRS